MATPTAEFGQNDFSAGDNTADHASSLAENEGVGFNYRIGRRGECRSRDGYVQLGSDTGTGAITMLGSYVSTGTVQHLLKITGDDLTEWDGADWNAIRGTATTYALRTRLANVPMPDEQDLDSGTIDTITINTLQDSGKSWAKDQYQFKVVRITSGKNSAEQKIILSNSTDTLTIRGAWDEFGVSGNNYKIQDIAPVALVVNGVDTPFKAIPAAAANSETYDLPSLKKFKKVVWWNDRAWAFEPDSSILRFSDIGNAESWPYENWLPCDDGDGQNLTGLGITGIGLAIYKDHKTGILTGDGPDNFRIDMGRDIKHGCIAPDSVASWNGLSFALDESGVYAFDGSVNAYKSRKIEPDFKDLNPTYLPLAVGYIWQNRYYLSVPKDTDSTENDRQFVMDLIQTFQTSEANKAEGVWSRDTYGVNGYAEYGNDLYGGSAEGVKVYQLETGNNDNGATIPFEYITGEKDQGLIGHIKKNKNFVCEMGAITSAEKTYIFSEVDNGGFETVGNMDMGQAGSLWGTMVWGVDDWGGADNIIETFKIGGRGRNIKFKFTHNTINQVILYKWAMNFKLRKFK